MFCTGKPNKLVLYLHLWSATYQQAASEPLLKSTLNDVCLISPNFSGLNNTPQALASDDAVARIKIAVNETQYKTKLKRVYLLTGSGGTVGR